MTSEIATLHTKLRFWEGCQDDKKTRLNLKANLQGTTAGPIQGTCHIADSAAKQNLHDCLQDMLVQQAIKTHGLSQQASSACNTSKLPPDRLVLSI